jgi:molecular chaperone GrpE
MGRIVRIPVRAVNPTEGLDEPKDPPRQREDRYREAEEDRVAGGQLAVEEPAEASIAPDEDTDWCDRALRMRAEMENYRKRQQRLAQDQIESERQRLLRAFLRVVDDLERALDAPASTHDLRQGVRLTHRSALQLLEREGVERIQPNNQPFDPTWQEAVSAIDYDRAGSAPDTVVQVLEPGYRLGDQLLRPAKVVVAV